MDWARAYKMNEIKFILQFTITVYNTTLCLPVQQQTIHLISRYGGEERKKKLARIQNKNQITLHYGHNNAGGLLN